MEEFLQSKLDQIQRELGEKIMKSVEAQLTAQFANFAKQLGQMGRPAVPSTPLPVKRTPPQYAHFLVHLAFVKLVNVHHHQYHHRCKRHVTSSKKTVTSRS